MGEFDAFISYSHAADGRLAPELQRGLQRLAKGVLQRRALSVFRDETGLSTNPHLWGSIESALDQSAWFVLLASPEAANSEWVAREVSTWLDGKPLDHLLIVVTDGELGFLPDAGVDRAATNCLPAPLVEALDNEPRWLDMRWARTDTQLDLRNGRFRAAMADLAAPIHGVAKDDLEGEDVRQQKRARRLAVSGVTAVALLAVASLVAAIVAVDQTNEAKAQRNVATAQKAEAQRARDAALARGLAAQSDRLLSTNENDLVLLLAVESQRFADQAGADSVAAAESYAALLRALSDDPLRVRHLEVPEGTVVEGFDRLAGVVDKMLYSPDGRTFAAVTQRGDVRLWDADTGQLHPVQPDPAGRAYGSPLAMSDTIVAYQSFTSSAGPTALWDVDAQALWKWQPPRPLDNSYPDFASEDVTSHLALSPNGLLARSFSRSPERSSVERSSVEVWDTNTGAVVAGPIRVNGFVDALALSDDGTQLAVSFVRPNLSSLSLELIDVSTGSSRWLAVAHPSSTTDFDHFLQPFSAWVTFSDDGTEVSSIVSRSTVGAIATLDAATGTIAPSNAVGRDRTVMAVSDDLQYLVLAAGVGDPGGPWGTQTPTEIVDADTGDVLASFETDNPPLQQATMPIRPNSTEFAVQRKPGRIVVRDWASVGAAPYAATTTPQRLGSAVAVHPDGDVIDLTEPTELLGVDITGINARWTVSPSGQVAIAAASTIEIWDPTSGEFVRSVDKPKGCAPGLRGSTSWGIAFAGTADDGIVVVRCGGILVAWDLASPGRTRRWVVQTTDQVFLADLQISPDRSRILVPANRLQLIDAENGDTIAEGFGGPVVNDAYSPDGSLILAADVQGDVHVFDADDLSPIKTLKPSGGAGSYGTESPALAVSPDNR